MSTSSTKPSVCSSPPPSFGSKHFNEFKLDHAWHLYPVPCVLSTVQYTLNFLMAGTSEFAKCHQDLLIWHIGTHWLTEYSSYTTEPEKLGLTKSLPFPSRMLHLIFCFGQKLTILVFSILTVLTHKLKQPLLEMYWIPSIFILIMQSGTREMTIGVLCGQCGWARTPLMI